MAGKGRPGPAPRITEEVLQRFEQGLCWGWNVEDSCKYAGISESSLYTLQRQRPELRSRFALLRKRKEMRARRNISLALEEGDINTSKWFLERRSADFGPKARVDMAVQRELDESEVVAQLQRLVALSRARAAAGATG